METQIASLPTEKMKNNKVMEAVRVGLEKAGYSSINNFIKLAVSEKLEREEKILK